MMGVRVGLWIAVAVALLGGPVGCASQTRTITPHYALTTPSFWKVERAAKSAGEPTKVIVEPYGDAVIDQGPGAQAPKDGNYDIFTADVHVWIYAWPAEASEVLPVDQAYRKLAGVAELALATHLSVPDQPIECNRLPRSYRIAGQEVPGVDLVRRPGWRTVLLGTKVDEVLLGVVARVEFEQDMGRYCHNLRNLQVQLQNLLDGLHVGSRAPTGTSVAPL